MKYRYAFMTGMLSAVLLIPGASTDLYAQRGGSAGRGRPAVEAPASGRGDTAGKPPTGGQETGRPESGGRPDTAGRGRPGGVGKPDVGGRPDAVGKPDKGDRGAAKGGRPAIADQVTSNPKLTGRLARLFPDGTDLAAASEGFKNLGEFVAAAHVSRNLGIPFDALKARMTGSDSMSLGQAIGDLAPKVNAKAEAEKAQREADEDTK